MAEPKFFADCMLCKLAKWLALMGYDSRFAGAGERGDLELVGEAKKEGRIFLTRDGKIPDVRGVRKIVIKEKRLEEQLRRVLRELGLKPDRRRFFTRCAACNAVLEPAPREEALKAVPPRVREHAVEFFRCPACARLYWSGTHVENTLKKMEQMGF